MSDQNEMPFIPLSELRKMRQMAFLYMSHGALTDRDLWRMMVSVEVNSRLANQWYAAAQEDRKTAKKLVEENERLKSSIRNIAAIVISDYVQTLMRKIEDHVENSRTDANRPLEAEQSDSASQQAVNASSGETT